MIGKLLASDLMKAARGQTQIEGVEVITTGTAILVTIESNFECRYRKVTSSNTSCLEAHAGFFRLLMKGIFDLYVL